LKNRNEVTNVLLTEYNAKHQRKLDRRDARAEGRAEGLTEGLSRGRAESIERMLRKGKSPEEIHDLLDYPMEEILRVEREVSTVK
jgi:predicted transposase YdaD